MSATAEGHRGMTENGGGAPSDASSGPVGGFGAGGVIRIATFATKPGRMTDLIAAAHENAATALGQQGCLSAEVATIPDDSERAIVVSRWASAAHLKAYLDWHQALAHSSMAAVSEGKPIAVHYPVV